MNNCSTIMAILQENRTETSVKVQEVLTKYGCHIRARMGLREGSVKDCSNMGLIILQLCSEDNVPSKMKEELDLIPNVKTKYMNLDF